MASTETPVAPATSTGTETAAHTSRYRPHLDGIRAVAVVLVLVFHAGAHHFTGGFVGVDVFFVLSGYLVTQLLLRDLRGEGCIGFARFYSRRFRRLLPAAFVVLIVTAAVYAAIASPSEAVARVDSFKAAFLYAANWYFIRNSTGYFSADDATNPVLQFWSLAVEEQFYLLWPLLLGGLFWFSRRIPNGRRVLFLVVAGSAIASLAWAFVLRGPQPDRAYFGTDTRAYQLLAGALIALAPSLIHRLGRYQRELRIAALAGVAAIIVVATSAIDLDPIGRGALVTALTVIVIVSLEHSTGGIAHRVLSVDPIVYLGRISYGTYLWHWPVVLVAARLWSLGSVAMIGVVCLVSTGLASISFQILERPVRENRRLDRQRVAVIACGLIVSIVSATTLVPRILAPRHDTVTATPVAERSSLTPLPASIDIRQVFADGFGTAPTCVDAAPSRCTVVRGTGKHVLLMGDSNAVMLVPSFTRIAQARNLTLSVEATPGCRWQQGLYYWTTDIRDRCRRNRTDAYARVISALHPDVIVLVNANEDSQQLPDQPDSRPDPALLRSSTIDSLRALRAPGRDIVVIEPLPAPADNANPLACLGQERVIEPCRYSGDKTPTRVEMLERSLAKRDPHLYTADFDKLVCPFLPICDPIVNGLVVKWDGEHLARRFAESLAPAITAYFDDNRLLGR
jgi:peptidoglycan/LPS O-acetylase OafA/YrhL